MKPAVQRWARRSLKFIGQLLLPLEPVPVPRAAPRKRTVIKKESAPELLALWLKIQQEYFPDRTDLAAYTVQWSPRRQKRILASCNIRHRKVMVAKEMQHESVSAWCEPLLYHEMCHAVLGEGIKRRGHKTPWHGRDFKALEARHPQSAALNIWMKSGGWTRAVRSHRARARWE